MNFKNRNQLLLLITMMVGTLMGCSSQDDATNQSNEAAAQGSEAETVEVSQATDAGEVNVYSGRKEALVRPLLEKFETETGIEVNLVTGKADALIERLKAEGVGSPADLLITVDAGRLYRAQDLGLTQPVENTVLNQAIPANLREEDGHWYGLSLRARPIMYALDRVDPALLSTYENLADESWEGKVCIRSSSNIYNQSLVASMVASGGVQATEDWAKAFVPNFARDPVGGDRDQIKAVAAGECDVAVANTYYLFGMNQSEDPVEKAAAGKVAVFWPNQSDRGTHVNVSGVALTRAAKNQDNAIRLMEYLASPESQAWYAQVNGEYPVRQDVEIDPLLTAWGQFKQDTVNIAELGKHNADAVKLMDRAGWQ